MKDNSKNALRALVFTALMIAVEVVLHRVFSIKTPLVIAHLGFLPIALLAYAYGPWLAAVGGCLAEVIGALLFPIGSFFFGFSVTAFLTGLVFGLFFYRRPVRLWRVAVCVAVISVAFTLLLDSFWLMLLYSKLDLLKDFSAMLSDEWFLTFAAGRLLKAGILLPVQIVMIFPALKLADRTNLLKQA